MTNPLDHDAVEANDPAVIPAPEIDPTAIVYIAEGEVPLRADDYEEFSKEDGFEELVLRRLDDIDEKLEALAALKEGVNTIGTMMNAVAETFDGLMQQVQKGGIGALLGGFMGGKKEDG